MSEGPEAFLSSPIGVEHAYQTVGLDKLGEDHRDGEAAPLKGEKMQTDIARRLASHYHEKVSAHLDEGVDHVPRIEDLATDFASRKDLVTSSVLNSDLGTSNMHFLQELPPQAAEAVMGKHQQVLARLQQELPKNPMPPAMFSAETWQPSDAAKREWLAKVDAAENPIDALSHGSAQVRQFAAEVHPETVAAFRKQLLSKLAEVEDVPYSAKMRLGRVMGGTGLPSQDPIIGGQLQHIWQQDAAEKSDSGHSQTARTQRAEQQKNKTIKQWYTQAQNLSAADVKE